jgi:carbon-monoxide dehydrogenase medium subunit
MTRWKQYHTPATIDEALMLLGQYSDSARIIAGGTDLILDMESGHIEPPDVLVDVTKIIGIDEIRQESDAGVDWIIIGAGVTHYQIERHLDLQQVGTCLTESCRVVGGPQVRSVATLGGNVAHALPAADGTIGLLALDAEVQICTLQNGVVLSLWQPLLSIFVGPGRNNLTRNQMIGAFRFRPTGQGEGSAFDRIMRPQGVALPVLGAAARLRLDHESRQITDAKLAIGPAGPIPFRATEAEAVLIGAEFSETLVEEVIIAAQQQAQLRTSKHRASQEYRHEMIAVLLRRVLSRAVERAKSDG